MYRLYICQAKDDCPWNIKPPENLSEIIENYNIVYALRSERVDYSVLEDIFKEGNIGKLRRYLLYSLSVGDLILAVTDKIIVFRCESVGWSKKVIR